VEPTHDSYVWNRPVNLTQSCFIGNNFALILRVAWQPGPNWIVTSLSGAPNINNLPVGVIGRLSNGELLETDDRS
jgi:hypothetical protein